MGDLGREAAWFTLHSVLAIVSLAVMMMAFTIFHPSAESSAPKVLASLLAFVVPMIGGFAATKGLRNHIGQFVWITGLLVFAAACVWVIDLPTGPGLCQDCGPGHLLLRLWRTFFDFSNGSGLISGYGVLVGFWAPVSLIGYAMGSRFALDQ